MSQLSLPFQYNKLPPFDRDFLSVIVKELKMNLLSLVMDNKGGEISSRRLCYAKLLDEEKFTPLKVIIQNLLFYLGSNTNFCY